VYGILNSLHFTIPLLRLRRCRRISKNHERPCLDNRIESASDWIIAVDHQSATNCTVGSADVINAHILLDRIRFYLQFCHVALCVSTCRRTLVKRQSRVFLNVLANRARRITPKQTDPQEPGES
jgi:hypothetical protein